MSTEENIAIVVEAFAAVERRDEQRQRELFHPEADFHWPPSLPYGRIDLEGGQVIRVGWEEAWDPLQPTEVEKSLDPRVVAANEREVVVLWRQRGVDAASNRFECPVLGLYEVRGRKLTRAQMFYFDTSATADFLASAARPAGAAT